MSTSPPREALASVTREVIERHEDWDSVHQFVTWYWDGEDLTPGTVAFIDPAIHPQDYGQHMRQVAVTDWEKHPESAPYAYLLQIEAFGVTQPGRDASEEERDRVEHARRTRTFHELPDAVESCVAYCADVHGRVWTAAKVRGREGISETFYQPGRTPGGQLIRALLAIAYATGMTDYGLPGPGSLAN
jgi:hypothetical protein